MYKCERLFKDTNACYHEAQSIDDFLIGIPWPRQPHGANSWTKYHARSPRIKYSPAMTDHPLNNMTDFPRFVEALKLCVSHSRTSDISTVDQLNKSMRLAWLRMTWISPKCVTTLITVRHKSQVLLSLIRSVFLLFGGKVRISVAHCELCGALTRKLTGNPCNSHLVCTNW